MKIHNLAFLLLFQFLFVSDVAFGQQQSDSSRTEIVKFSQQNSDSTRVEIVNTVLKSTDGGQSWQDISEGLPGNVQGEGFFTNDKGFYLCAGNEIFHSTANSSAASWKKEVFPAAHSSITPGKNGIFAYTYAGEFLQKPNETSTWSPIFSNFPEKEVRTVYETAGGTVFIGCDKGLFKSTNQGKTWKLVHNGGWAMKMVESNGVLLATSQVGIIRSSDGGENWDAVISEGGVGIAIELIKGGVAAITYNTRSETRRVRTSYDGGKTWQAIDAGLPPSLSIASIVQVGESFFCGHPSGIYRSSDKGKTWELLLPSMGNKVFNLSVSGNVIYAIPRDGGC